MDSQAMQYEDLSDYESETENEIDNESETESEIHVDEIENIRKLFGSYSFPSLSEQVCVDIKKGMSHEEVIKKYKDDYMERMDESLALVIERYELLRKLQIFEYMTETNEHLEQIRDGDFDENWVEAFKIHKNKLLHPQLEPYIISRIEKCLQDEKKKNNVLVGYGLRY